MFMGLYIPNSIIILITAFRIAFRDNFRVTFRIAFRFVLNSLVNRGWTWNKG